MSKQDYISIGTVTAGNSIYRVFVQDNPTLGIGLYTATTGPDHPAGSGLNVLFGFGGGSPGTTYNTIRSYTSGTDYVQITSTPSSPFNIVSLTSFGTIAPIGTTGFRTTYVLPGPPATPDALTIVTDVNVNGTTFADSTIEVTTIITNNGADPVSLGIRYLWDFQVASDDGPTFQQINTDGPTLVNEAQFTSPGFESYKIQDNDVSPNPPTYDIFGTVNGPSAISPPPTPPQLLQFVSWPASFSTAFNYTINPALNIADLGQGPNDSAVNYFFGPDDASAITINPGSSKTFSESLFVTPPIERGIAF